jgi:hypothetical protein
VCTKINEVTPFYEVLGGWNDFNPSCYDPAWDAAEAVKHAATEPGLRIALLKIDRVERWHFLIIVYMYSTGVIKTDS